MPSWTTFMTYLVWRLLWWNYGDNPIALCLSWAPGIQKRTHGKLYDFLISLSVPDSEEHHLMETTVLKHEQNAKIESRVAHRQFCAPTVNERACTACKTYIASKNARTSSSCTSSGGTKLRRKSGRKHIAHLVDTAHWDPHEPKPKLLRQRKNKPNVSYFMLQVVWSYLKTLDSLWRARPLMIIGNKAPWPAPRVGILKKISVSHRTSQFKHEL